MKKWICLVLVACMMMALPFGAMAEAVDAQDVLQNELAPEFVPVETADGEEAYAILYDKEGNVVSYITSEADLGRVDVYLRDTAEDAVVAERLTKGYLAMMADVNYSDVPCALHEDDLLKDEINEVLKDSGLDALDLVMYEQFDLNMYGEYADYLAEEGGVLEVKLQLLDWQPAPIVVVISEEGEKWSIVPDVTDNGDGTITVRVDKLGVVSLLMECSSMLTIQDTYDERIYIPYDIEGDKNEIDFNFTPSVVAKPAPLVIGGYDETGLLVIGTIENVQGTLSLPVGNDDVIVASVAERDYYVDIQTHEHLEWAYDEILNAETIGDLTEKVNDDGTEVTIAASVDEYLAGRNLGLTHQDMVVCDLFEVSAYGDCLLPFYEEGSYLKITFEMSNSKNDTLMVLVSGDSQTWSVVPAEYVAVNADGTVTVCLEELGAVAFLVDVADSSLANAGDAVMSPATDD